MKRWIASLLAVLLSSGWASAHFIWIVPDGPAAAKVVFSDDLSPDENVSVEKISATKMLLLDSAGKTTPLAWKKGEHAYLVALPGKGLAAIGGVCHYGVIQRGGSKPFLLAYYPKLLRGDLKDAKSWDALPLEIVVLSKSRARVLFGGKPLAGAEVVVIGESKAKLTSDAQGEVRIDVAQGPLHGIRAKHVANKSGEHKGKKYDEVRHYATLVFGIAGKEPPASSAAPAGVSLLPPLPTAVSSFGAAACDGQVYVYGGHRGKAHVYSTDTVIGTLHRMSLASPKEWVKLPDGPALQGLAMIAHGGKLYRIGGMFPKNKPDEKSDINSVAACACYDPAAEKWQPAPDLPAARSSHDAVVVGDKIIVVGGWQLNGGGRGSSWHDTALILDLSAKKPSWQAVKQPFKRRALTAAAHDGKVYVMGGLIGGDKGKDRPKEDKTEGKGKVRQTAMGGMTLEVNIFDPATGAWTKGPSMPEPMRNAFSAAACSTGGKLYLSTSDGNLYRLAAKGDAWEKVGEVQQRRFVHRLVPAGDQRILVLGGASGAGPVAITEEIVLPSNR